MNRFIAKEYMRIATSEAEFRLKKIPINTKKLDRIKG